MQRRFDNVLQVRAPAEPVPVRSASVCVSNGVVDDDAANTKRRPCNRPCRAPAQPQQFDTLAGIAEAGIGSADRNPLSDKQFRFFRDFALNFAGIVIADFKNSMVARRVRTRLKALSLTSIDEYIDYLHRVAGHRELQNLVNALTTNKTEFFRESHHFQHLGRDALALLAQARGGPVKRLRVWSAGCSTGEEAYSIAMTLHSAHISRANLDVRILATDIDTKVLSVGRGARYNTSDMSTVPLSFRSSYFSPVSGEPHKLRVSPKLRDMISFQHLNLHEPWSMKGPFDVVFCRNVVIYFDKATQRRLFDRIADILIDGGLLYCGHSESLYGVSSRFKAIGQSIYQRIS